jgi:hypothetical protein
MTGVKDWILKTNNNNNQSLLCLLLISLLEEKGTLQCVSMALLLDAVFGIFFALFTYCVPIFLGVLCLCCVIDSEVSI